MTRAERRRQHLRNQVEVDGYEERGLLRIAHLVLVEGGVVALNTRIHDGRAGKRANVRQTALRQRRGTGGARLLPPRGPVPTRVVLPRPPRAGPPPPALPGAPGRNAAPGGVGG